MRSSYAWGPGMVLVKSPNARRQSTRRRLVIVFAVVALAAVSGALGSLIHPADHAVEAVMTGPFSYFPTQ